MRAILLCTSLVLAIAFSGCDDSNTQQDLTTSSVDGFTHQQMDLNISAGNTEIAMLNTIGVSFEIRG